MRRNVEAALRCVGWRWSRARLATHRALGPIGLDRPRALDAKSHTTPPRKEALTSLSSLIRSWVSVPCAARVAGVAVGHATKEYIRHMQVVLRNPTVL